MNTIKTSFFVAAMVMASTSAWAQPLYTVGNYISREEAKIVSVAPTSTSDEAYQLALSELNTLKSLPANKLNKAFNMLAFNMEAQSTHLKDGGFITVQERMNEYGQLEYQGKVNVTVHYVTRDNNR